MLSYHLPLFWILVTNSNLWNIAFLCWILNHGMKRFLILNKSCFVCSKSTLKNNTAITAAPMEGTFNSDDGQTRDLMDVSKIDSYVFVFCFNLYNLKHSIFMIFVGF